MPVRPSSPRPRAVRRVAPALAWLALLQGCAGTAPAPAVAPPEVVAPAPAQVASASAEVPADERALVDAFVRARALVAGDVGIALDDLELVVAGDARIDELVRRETRRLVRAQFDDPAFAERFVERMMRGQRGTFVALYSPATESVLVNRRLFTEYVRSVAGEAPVREAAVLALMIHEIVHAADDRRHDIDGTRTLDFRASFAESAVYEGHAQWRTRRLCERAGCLPGLDALDAFMFDAPDGPPAPNRIAQSAVALSRNVLEYSYVEGERFVAALARRPDAEGALERLLSAPPSDPVQILDPGSWPDLERESRNRRMLDAAAGFDHPWHAPGWARVETSPLKGVNLRADPARRVAAVEGFTRLLVSMGALELHDQRDADGRSVEITLLEGESAETAALFARTLHANAPGTLRSSGPAGGAAGAGEAGGSDGAGEAGDTATELLHAELPGIAGETGWRTLVARRDAWVVQIAAPADEPPARLERWAEATFERLAAG